jgi:hypothetical protein
MGNLVAAAMPMRVVPWALKFLKPVAVVAAASVLLIRFPQIWPALGLERIEEFGK